MNDEPPHRGEPFATTHWSVVLAAARACPETVAPAWQELARAYWFPLYAYVRRRGCEPEDAADLTQTFFVRLIEKRTLKGLERDGGRFRSFLLTCLNHFLTEEWRRGQATTRRPAQGWVPLDAVEAERRYACGGPASATPEELFERRWAESLVDGALARLETHYAEAGRASLCGHLIAYLNDDPGALPHAAIAERVGLSAASVRVELLRLRHVFRVLAR